jgi:hypothetical protein
MDDDENDSPILDWLMAASLNSISCIPLVLLVGGGYRSFVWLKHGYWPEITLVTVGQEIPQSSWAGVQKSYDYIYLSMALEWVANSALLVLASIFFAAFCALFNVFDNEEGH